jgi:hypothetical protein
MSEPAWPNRCPECWRILGVVTGFGDHEKLHCPDHGWISIRQTVFECPLNLSSHGMISGSVPSGMAKNGGSIFSRFRAWVSSFSSKSP